MSDHRAAILALHAAEHKPATIAKMLKVHCSTVTRAIKRGTVKLPKRVVEKTVRTDDLMDTVKEAINDRHGKVTIRGLAREFNVDKRTIGRLVHEQLNLKSYKRTRRQGLKEVDKEKRICGSKKIVTKLKQKPRQVVLLFSDETPFSLCEMTASDTGFYLAESVGGADDDVVHISKERHYTAIHVLGVIGSDGQKCPLVFLKDHERLTADTYQQYLHEHVFPWARMTYGDQWWWQQDGASCHTANSTQEFLRRETPFFFDKTVWPPHSPNLNPLDYAIFGKLKGMLSGTRFTSKE